MFLSGTLQHKAHRNTIDKVTAAKAKLIATALSLALPTVRTHI